MPSPAASFESFPAELNRLVGHFERHHAHTKTPDSEATTRFLLKARREMADSENPSAGTPMPAAPPAPA